MQAGKHVLRSTTSLSPWLGVRPLSHTLLPLAGSQQPGRQEIPLSPLLPCSHTQKPLILTPRLSPPSPRGPPTCPPPSPQALNSLERLEIFQAYVKELEAEQRAAAEAAKEEARRQERRNRDALRALLTQHRWGGREGGGWVGGGWKVGGTRCGPCSRSTGGRQGRVCVCVVGGGGGGEGGMHGGRGRQGRVQRGGGGGEGAGGATEAQLGWPLAHQVW
jgi:hypothetical protein